MNLMHVVVSLVRDNDECLPITTRLTKVVSEQAELPCLMADPLIAAAHNHSTVFAKKHQCACPSHTVTPFLGPIRPTTPYRILIEFAILSEFMVVTNGQTDRRTDQQNVHRTELVRTGY